MIKIMLFCFITVLTYIIIKYNHIKKLAYKLTKVTYNYIKQDQGNIDRIKSTIEKTRGCSLDGKFKVINTKYMFYYMYQNILSFLFDLFVLIIISLLLGTFVETMLVCISFISVRIFAGGMHFQSFTKCTYFSIIIFIILGLVAKYMPYSPKIIFIFYSTILGVYVKYAPAENVNRLLTKSEKARFKRLSITMLIIIFVVQLVYHNHMVSNACLLSVTLSGIITTPLVNKYCK